MIILILLLAIFLWQYRKRTVYNPYETKYSRSAYEQVGFTPASRCTQDICRILSGMAGCRRFLHRFRVGTDGEAELILIHESGIYVICSADLEGTVSGNPAGRYWKQSFREGWLFACRNYIGNPFLTIKEWTDEIRWELRDMPEIPYYSLAVFGSRANLQTAGYLGDNCWSLTLSQVSVTVAQIMRKNRKYLKPEQVEQIYRKLIGDSKQWKDIRQ